METKAGKMETVKRDLMKPFGGRGIGKHRIRACGGGPSGGSQVYGDTHERMLSSLQYQPKRPRHHPVVNVIWSEMLPLTMLILRTTKELYMEKKRGQ